MAGGMKRHQSVADLPNFAEFNGFYGNFSQPVLHDRRTGIGAHVAAMARAGVVGMAVGDQRTVHGAPRVDVEIARRAVDAAIGKGKNGVRHGIEYRRCA